MPYANKEVARIYSRDWARKHTEISRRYYRKHCTRIIRRVVLRHKRLLATDPLYRLIKNYRNRILLSLKPGHYKFDCTHHLLGCSPRQFKQHLEALFLPGMSWMNRRLWHIDHKKPVSSFDLTTEEGQRAAFHYTNTQPLWAVDNLRKGAKV